MQTPISDAFFGAIYPLLIDFGKVIFACSLIFAFYHIIRRNVTEGVDRLKYAIYGYVGLRFLEVFIKFTDKVADTMSKNIHP
jgi:hypothetical protein